MEYALMKTPRNCEADNFVGHEQFPPPADFPTAEELLAGLDASLEPSFGLLRPRPTAVAATSQALTQRWRELTGDALPTLPHQREDEHYLSDWPARQSVSDVIIEPDFLADFTQFLMRRVAARLTEVRAAQHLLARELAKLQG
jgi:hypothetical protein